MAVGRREIKPEIQTNILDNMSLGFYKSLLNVADLNHFMVRIEILRQQLASNALSKVEMTNLLWVALQSKNPNSIGLLKTLLSSEKIDANTQIPQWPGHEVCLPLVVCAARFGNLSALKFLLEDKRANYHSPGCQYTPLEMACADGDLNIVNYFLDQNIQPEPSALIAAVVKANLHVIDRLIDHGGYSVNTPNAVGMMPITFAIRMVKPDAVRRLVELGANLSPIYPIEHPMITLGNEKRDLEAGRMGLADSDNPADLTKKLSDLKIIEEILISHGIAENTESFAPALFSDLCSIQGDRPMMEELARLLGLYSDIIFKSGALYDGCKMLTPENRSKVLETVVDSFPDSLIPKENSSSPQKYLSLLHICARFNQTNLVKRLVNKGHVIDLICEEDELTPLHIATVYNAKEMVFYLLELGVNLNARTQQGDTALHFAVSKPGIDIDIIKKMLSHPDFTFSSLDPFQRNIIHKAVISRQPKILKAVLSRLKVEECQSVLFARDHEGKTPLMHAISLGNASSIIQILSTLIVLGIIQIDTPLDKIEPVSAAESDLLLSVLYAHSNMDAIAHLAVRLLSTNKTNKNGLQADFLQEISTVMLNSDEFKSYIPHNLQAYSQALITFFQQMTKVFAENKKTAELSAAISKYQLAPLDVVILDPKNIDNDACTRLFGIFSAILIKFRADARNAIKYTNTQELEGQQRSAHHFMVIFKSLLEKLIGNGESIREHAWYKSWHQNLAEVYRIFADIDNALLKEIEKLRIGDDLLAEEKKDSKKSVGAKRSSKKKNKKLNSNPKIGAIPAVSKKSPPATTSLAVNNEFGDEIAQLRAACLSEDLDSIKQLLCILDLPCQPDILIHCIDSKLNKSLQLLLNAGYSPNVGILGNITPLSAAIAAGNLDAMTMLFDAGVDVCPPFPNQQPLVQVKYKRHSLEQEIEKGCFESATFYKLRRDLDFYKLVEERLIAQGAESDLNNFLPSYFKYLCDIAVNTNDVLNFIKKHQDNLGIVLQYALYGGLASLAEKKLSVEAVLNAFVNLVPDTYIFKTQETNTPLYFSLMHIAVLHHSMSALQRLISRGHYVDFKASIDCVTPLHLAVTHGTAEIRKYLISKGANVNEVDSDSNTPLHTAIQKMNISVICELLSCKPKIDIPNADQDTQLHLACLSLPTEIIKLMILSVALLDEPTPLFSKNKDNITPIQWVACSKDMKILEAIVVLLRGQKYFPNDAKPHSITQQEKELLLALLSIGVEIEAIPELALGLLAPAPIVVKPVSGEAIQRMIHLAENKLLQVNIPAAAKSYLEKLFKYFKLMSIGMSSKQNLEDVVQNLLAVNLSIPDFVSLSWDISINQKVLCDKLFVFLINIALDHIYKVDVLFSDLQGSNISTSKQQLLLQHLKSNLIGMRRFLVAAASDTDELEFEKCWIQQIDTYNDMLDKHSGLVKNKEESHKAGEALLMELSDQKTKTATPKKSKAKKAASIPKNPKAAPSLISSNAETQRLLKAERIKADELRQAAAKAKKAAAKEAKLKRIVALSPESEKAFTFVREKIGVSAYLVGGAVLDLLSQSEAPSNDFDMIFASTTNVAENLLAAKFYFPPPLVAVKPTDMPLSFYQYRDKEQNFYLDLVQVHSDDPDWLQTNAKTRDFTICALYAQPTKDPDGKPKVVIIDPTGRGFTDFDKKILHIDDAIQRFNEDPVRLLRALKYIVKGFKPDTLLETALTEWRAEGDLLAGHKAHLWSVLNSQLNAKSPELTTYEAKFLTYLRKYDLVSELFGVQTTSEQSDLDVKKALMTRFRMIKAAQNVKSEGYTPSQVHQPEAYSPRLYGGRRRLVASSSSTSSDNDQHPLSYVMKS